MSCDDSRCGSVKFGCCMICDGVTCDGGVRFGDGVRSAVGNGCDVRSGGGVGNGGGVMVMVVL